MNLFQILSILLFLNYGSINCLDDSIFRSIDLMVNLAMLESQTPGFGITVVADGEHISKGYGSRSLNPNVPVNKDTLFAIGSNTKSFTSVLTVKVLSELYPNEGERMLDAPLSSFLPNSTIMFSDRFRWQSLTFRDMLAHKTCLFNGPDLGFAADVLENEEEFIYRLRYAPEICAIRSEFVYNNGMYDMAGYVLGKIAGSSFNQLANDLLQDLGMTNSVLVTQTSDFDNFPNKAEAYYLKNGQVTPYDIEHVKKFSYLVAAGGVFASLDDMGKYVQFLANHGKVGDRQVVKEEAMKWLYRISNLNDYALGLLILNDGTNPMLAMHAGYLPPYQSTMTYYPDWKFGIFSSVNGPAKSDSMPAAQLLIHVMMYNHLLDRMAYNGSRTAIENLKYVDFQDKVTGGEILKSGMPIIQKNSTQNYRAEEFVGLYGNALEGDFRIEYRNDANGEYYMNYGKWGKGYLMRITNDIFEPLWDTDLDAFYIAMAQGGPVNPIYVGFHNPNLISIGTTFFVRNATLPTYPEIPWSPNSCAP